MSDHDQRPALDAPAAGFAQDLVDAARENPISTALIGVGALWLFMGGSKVSIFGEARDALGTLSSRVGAPVAGTVARETSSRFSAIRGTIADAGAAGSARVSDAASASKHGVTEAADALTNRLKMGAEHAFDVAADAGSSLYEFAQSAPQRGHAMVEPLEGSLADLWNRQPLILGAIGLAVGASLAAALPQLALEESVLGETAESLKSQAKDVFSDQVSKLGDAFDAVKTKAQQQGLTPERGIKAVLDVVSSISNGTPAHK